MRRVSVVSAGGLAVALVLVAPSVAAAAELPSHQRITTIDSNTGVVYDVDPVTGAATELWNTEIPDVSGLTLDDSGQGYVTSWTGSSWQSALWSIDIASQTVISLGELTLAGTSSSGACAGLQQYQGSLFGYCGYYEAEFFGGTNTYARIDPATAEFTPVFTFTRGGTESVLPAIDPADGATFFTASRFLFLFDLATLDTSIPDWATSRIVAEFSTEAGGADFSDDGVLWVPLLDSLSQSTSLATWSRATGEIETVGPLTAGDAPIFAVGLTVWGAAAPPPAPGPQLVASGSTDLAPIALLALWVVIAGSLFVASRGRAARN